MGTLCVCKPISEGADSADYGYIRGERARVGCSMADCDTQFQPRIASGTLLLTKVGKGATVHPAQPHKAPVTTPGAFSAQTGNIHPILLFPPWEGQSCTVTCDYLN